MTGVPPGINYRNVCRWFAESVPKAGGNLTFSLVGDGRSNLTYLVRGNESQWVLRRPPLGHVLPTAHDMAREFRVQSALHGTRVPVPRTLYLADAGSVLGVPFYLMERVVGHVCRNQLPPGYGETAAEREAIGGALIDTLAHLHAI